MACSWCSAWFYSPDGIKNWAYLYFRLHPLIWIWYPITRIFWQRTFGSSSLWTLHIDFFAIMKTTLASSDGTIERNNQFQSWNDPFWTYLSDFQVLLHFKTPNFPDNSVLMLPIRTNYRFVWPNYMVNICYDSDIISELKYSIDSSVPLDVVQIGLEWFEVTVYYACINFKLNVLQNCL